MTDSDDADGPDRPPAGSDPTADEGEAAGSRSDSAGPSDVAANDGSAPADAPGGAPRSPSPEGSPTPGADGSETVIGKTRRLDPRVQYLWVLGRVVGAVFMGAIAAVASSYFLGSVGQFGRWPAAFRLGGVVAALFLLYAVVRAVLLYRSWRYVVREESLFLKRGVFTRVQTVVPYVRVQHIDTRRSPFERLTGLSSLVVYTAGSRGADVTIPGLTPDRAADLQARLERLAIESEDEDAV